MVYTEFYLLNILKKNSNTTSYLNVDIIMWLCQHFYSQMHFVVCSLPLVQYFCFTFSTTKKCCPFIVLFITGKRKDHTGTYVGNTMVAVHFYNVSSSESLEQAVTCISVSYTHLDVYKRQVLGSRRRSPVRSCRFCHRHQTTGKLLIFF